MKNIIVTGGAGFIGSRVIKKLNDSGVTNIILVDDLTDGTKINNIKDLQISDYIDKENFIEILSILAENDMVSEIYHFGAESSTTCNDGKYLMSNNYQFTCNIMNICAKHKINLLYASSASVYGSEEEYFHDEKDNYQPNNMYGFSKLQADKYARPLMKKCKMIGLRYFNVYSDGEFETHKVGMKSPTAWMKEQYVSTGKIKLFKGSDDYKRDFIHIDEAVDKTIHLMEICKSGVYNIGTGEARSFLQLAKDEIGVSDSDIEYINMPDELQQHYQKYTKANMSSYEQII